MKRLTSVKLCICALATSLTAVAAAPDSDSMTEALDRAQGPQSDMIVILRDQISSAPPMRHAMSIRASALAAAQHPLISELQQGKSRNVRSFSTINAFATSLTAAEAAHLTLHPEVAAVLPDMTIHARKSSSSNTDRPPSLIAKSTPSASSSALCNTLEPEALQITNTAFLNPSTPQAQSVIDGNGNPVTGRGVKVAYIADGLDPTVKGFVRPDGSSVFIDFQNFSADPAGTPTAGGEAFGDASSIAAQDDPNGKTLFFDISKYVAAAHPLPSPCNIQIRGMAPGASLVGLNVFSNLGFTTTSNFVQAIEWAVTHDDVDVINESFGGNPFADTVNDPISLADQAAIKAGVTVVVSTGDAGTAGTLGSPATDPSVIAVGATNQWRVYAQTSDGAIPLTPHGGFVNNNISAFSSAGFAQHNARTVDVVAPGDSGWALCSTNPDLFTDCTAFNGSATPIEVFGGTSESSPLTAGEAALVIQAYRSTHHGTDPSPALVRQIIMSTATDLGAPSDEQGAGMINSLAAVNAALSTGTSKEHGTELLASPTSTTITDLPNGHHQQTYTITNPGTTALQLSPSLETLGAPVAGANQSLTLNPAKDPTFVNSGGGSRPFIKSTFKVPAGVQHLDAAVAFQIDLTSTNSPLVLFALLDPSGNQVAYSVPQGTGNGYGHVDVDNPVAGTWTVFVWTRPAGDPESYSGPIQFTWAAENYVKFGSVSPAKFTLAPGHSQTVTAAFNMPATPGDVGAALRFDGSESASTVKLPQIPVSLRTMIPTTSTGAVFSGTLTGGNGRPGAGPTQTWAFDVPSGVSNLSLSLSDADSGYILEGFLIDPNGMQLSVEPSLDPAGNPVFGLQLFKNNPQAGQWQFVLLLDYFSSGNQTTLPFTARIGFNGAHVVTSGVPDSASVKLSASKTTTATISFINTGTVTEAFFADARLNSTASTSLPTVSNPNCTSGITTLPGTCGQFIVPPETATVQFTAKSTVPINMDAFNFVGFLVGMTQAPDIFAKKTGTDTVTASLTEPEIPWGTWSVVPSEIGPYGPAGGLTKNVTMTAVATTRKFDTAVSADSGDLWADVVLGTNTFKPLVLGSGEEGTITLSIKPSASEVGKTVTGFIYLDTFNPNVGTGDEVVRIPYSYTVEK